MLRKLGGEELALNISLFKMSAQWKAAVEGWLNSESQYRLRIEQAKEAKQGSKFAEEEYEKYREAEKRKTMSRVLLNTMRWVCLLCSLKDFQEIVILGYYFKSCLQV